MAVARGGGWRDRGGSRLDGSGSSGSGPSGSGLSGSDALGARQRLEMLGGFVGFFAVLALVNAVGLIVTGRPSMLASFVLLLMVIASWFTFRAWRRADRAVRRT